MNLHRKGIEKISELSIPSSAQQACPIEQGQSQLSQSLTKGSLQKADITTLIATK